MLATLFDPSLPLTPSTVRGEVDALVDDAQVAIVVQDPLIGTVPREDVDPEIDVAIELGRLRKGLGVSGSAGQQQDQRYDSTIYCHMV